MRTLLLLLASVIVAVPAAAAPITYQWSGTVDPAAGFPGIAPQDTPIGFALTYDLGQANTCATGRGFFSLSGSMSVLGGDWGPGSGGIEVNNPLGNLCSDPVSGFQSGDPSSFVLRLLVSGALPVDHTQPNGPVTQVQSAVIFFNAPFDATLQTLGHPQTAGIIVRGMSGATLLEGTVSYRQVQVPEPGMLTLAALALAGLWRRPRTPRA